MLSKIIKPRPTLCGAIAVLSTVLEAIGVLCIPFQIFMTVRGHLHPPATSFLTSMRLAIDNGAIRQTSPSFAPTKIEFDGTLWLSLDPTLAGKLEHATRLPIAMHNLRTMVFVLAVAELFRRLFRSAARREVFTTINVRRVRWIGALILLNGVLGQVISEWHVLSTFAFAHSSLSIEGISFMPPQIMMNWASLVQPLLAGLVVLALAEVFNQGVVLKQENDLTV